MVRTGKQYGEGIWSSSYDAIPAATRSDRDWWTSQVKDKNSKSYVMWAKSHTEPRSLPLSAWVNCYFVRVRDGHPIRGSLTDATTGSLKARYLVEFMGLAVGALAP